MLLNTEKAVGMPEISLNTEGNLSQYTGTVVEHREKAVGIPEISLNKRANYSRYTGNIVEHTGKPESVYRRC